MKHTIVINDESNIIDRSAVLYAVNHLIRDMKVKYYMDATANPTSENLQACHLRNMKANRQVNFSADVLEVNIAESPVVILSDKMNNVIIESCDSIQEVESTLETRLYFIGKFRQAKGLRDSIRHSASRTIAYEESKAEALIEGDR